MPFTVIANKVQWGSTLSMAASLMRVVRSAVKDWDAATPRHWRQQTRSLTIKASEGASALHPQFMMTLLNHMPKAGVLFATLSLLYFFLLPNLWPTPAPQTASDAQPVRAPAKSIIAIIGGSSLTTPHLISAVLARGWRCRALLPAPALGKSLRENFPSVEWANEQADLLHGAFALIVVTDESLGNGVENVLRLAESERVRRVLIVTPALRQAAESVMDGAWAGWLAGHRNTERAARDSIERNPKWSVELVILRAGLVAAPLIGPGWTEATTLGIPLRAAIEALRGRTDAFPECSEWADGRDVAAAVLDYVDAAPARVTAAVLPFAETLHAGQVGNRLQSSVIAWPERNSTTATTCPPGQVTVSGMRSVSKGLAELAQSLAVRRLFQRSTQAREIVAVTGASGFLAGHVVHQMLAMGFAVRGSVRNLNDSSKIRHLQAEFPNLELFSADLMKEGSFDAMMQGATLAVHTASPFQTQGITDPQQQLVDPAVRGTLNVLRSARASGTVRRVVLTSSMAAVSPDTPPPDQDRVWTEDDWNLESTLQSNPYRLSKRLAEQAAWDFVRSGEGAGLELATVNPSFILGPPLSGRGDAVSVATVKGFLDGRFRRSGAPGSCFGAVDVRDVALAHVRALLVPEARDKRFIVSSREGWSSLRLANLLQRRFGAHGWPLPAHEQQSPRYCPRMDNSRAERVLGLEFTPLQSTLEDMAQVLVAQGSVRHPSLPQTTAHKGFGESFARAAKRALGGGAAGALAMVIQVLALMWLRTTMNFQYRYGHCMTHAMKLLYREGGILRFYNGLLPALIQAPLSRFCDTAANTGVLSLLDAWELTACSCLSYNTVPRVACGRQDSVGLWGGRGVPNPVDAR
eukprot:TRINITY_DN7889_c0_g1_i1.p1 TRINITY_DN7889_c0_g1~~TRINITY_DN7889_c0_g1_i1.p1  ORF type:complete len:863 (-),score=83.56 TRINITY_DN7889_c0_g1_i1:491-3079(-)